MAIVVKTLPNQWLALGVAAHYVGRRAPFGDFTAGDLVRTLSGQVERGHYLLAFDTGTEPARVVGYYGWALYPHAVAERFAEFGAPPPDDPGHDGEVVWILTAAAEDRAAFFALAKAARARYPQHRVMAVRHKRDRRVVFDQWRARTNAETGSV
jgi:hypothetical protein